MPSARRLIIPGQNTLAQAIALSNYVLRFPAQTDAEFDREMSKHAVKAR